MDMNIRESEWWWLKRSRPIPFYNGEDSEKARLSAEGEKSRVNRDGEQGRGGKERRGRGKERGKSTNIHGCSQPKPAAAPPSFQRLRSRVYDYLITLRPLPPPRPACESSCIAPSQDPHGVAAPPHYSNVNSDNTRFQSFILRQCQCAPASVPRHWTDQASSWSPGPSTFAGVVPRSANSCKHQR